MPNLHHRARPILVVLVVAGVLTACAGLARESAPVSITASAPAPASQTAPAASPAPSLSPATDGSPGPGASDAPTTPPTGFAFAAEDIRAYYGSIGYDCADPTPSRQALGYLLYACSWTDDAGRDRVIGLVTDPNGSLSDAYGSISASPEETAVAAADAYEPLAAFLGSVLGEVDGTTAALWLAEHVGSAYEQTELDAVTVATYTEAEDDASRIYVEVANQAYLAAPTADAP